MPRGIEPREGYELWHPNREKPEAKTTKAIVAFVLVISAVLLVIITLGGWTRLQSSTVGIMTLAWAAMYLLFAYLVMRWNRGVLPVSAAFAVIMVIFAAVAAPGWFARDKPGLDSPALPEDLLGLLTVIVIPVQLLLVVVAMVGFNQAWNVEEERPVGGSTPGPPPDDGRSGVGPSGEDSEVTPALPEQPGPPRTALVDDGDDWDGTTPNPAV